MIKYQANSYWNSLYECMYFFILYPKTSKAFGLNIWIILTRMYVTKKKILSNVLMKVWKKVESLKVWLIVLNLTLLIQLLVSRTPKWTIKTFSIGFGRKPIRKTSSFILKLLLMARISTDSSKRPKFFKWSVVRCLLSLKNVIVSSGIKIQIKSLIIQEIYG